VQAVAISTAKTRSPKTILSIINNRINVPDWFVYCGLVANFIFILLLKDPLLDAIALTITSSFLVAMAIRYFSKVVMFGRRQLRTLKAFGAAISSILSTPLVLLAQTTPTDGTTCQSAGFLTPIAQFAFNALSATPFLASWFCNQIALVVVIGMVALAMVIVWVIVELNMNQQPLTYFIKPVLSVMMGFSIIAGIISLATYTGTGTATVPT
jgi:uncharacterized protein YhhL (DUF1145 family)